MLQKRPFAVFVVAFGIPLMACTHGVRPIPSDAQVVRLSASLGNAYVKAAEPVDLVARVTVDARAAESRRRPQANVALVVDTSGSMEGKPIADARAASLALLDALEPHDHLAVVVFNSKPEVLLPTTELSDADLADVHKRLAGMKAEGTTDMAGGVTAGIDEVKRSYDANGVNRVILVGDGVPNDEGPIRALAQSAAGQGISITSLGLGPDYNESLMGEVAQISGGLFHYVDDSSKVAAFFHEEVTRLQRVFARGALVELSPGPGVVVDSVVGHEVARVGGHVTVNLGDLSLGDRRELIVRLHAGAHRDGSPVEVMDATVSYGEGVEGTRVEKHTFLGARATSDSARLAQGKDDEVLKDAAKMQAAADKLEEIKKARAEDQAKEAPRQAPPRGRSPNAPSPAPAAAAPYGVAPEAQKRQHDDAMQVLQGQR